MSYRHIIMLIVSSILLSYFGWKLDRWLNWEFQYKSYVEDAVRDSVLPECLI